MREGRWLNTAAIVTWLICGLSQFLAIAQGAFDGWPAAVWVAAYVVYGTALLMLLGLVGAGLMRARYSPLVFIAIQIVAALTVIALSLVYRFGTNATPALLVIIAATLPYLAPSTAPSAPPETQVTLAPAWIWSIVAALALTHMAFMFAADSRWTAALTFGLTMGGFMLFAAASSFLVRSEAAAREELAAVNAELLRTRAQLAETSRVEERLRISRDLHDTLGHHLTALSLQLDVAARLSEGPVADHISRAHAITRLLLGDVRDVVSQLREASQPDVAQSIRAIAAEHEGLAIHLDLPDTLSVDDRSRAEALLRCVQEIVTNTVRHAQARNLWIEIRLEPGGIAVEARDDGRGAPAYRPGQGLTGMGERLQELGGSLVVASHPGRGFEVRALLPLAEASS